MPEPAEPCAVGAVLWRGGGSCARSEQVALVRQGERWCLPELRRPDGVHPLVALGRLVAPLTEEPVAAGRPLGTTTGGGRTVRWWAVRSLGQPGRSRPGGPPSPASLCWLSPDDALRRLDEQAAPPLRRLLDAPVATTTVALVRHAQAGDRHDWAGEDEARPLDDDGRRDAAELAGLLAAHRPRRVVSAPAVRCVQTVQPLADALGLDVETAAPLGEQAHSRHPEQALPHVLEQAASADGCVVLCSQGAVLPDLLAALLPPGCPPPGKPEKGSVWVLSFDATTRPPTVVAAEHWRPGT